MAKKEKIQSAAFRRNTLTVVAVVLFGLIVLSEIFLAVSIPWYLQQENTMAQEVLRINLRSSYDTARTVSGRFSSRDEVRQAEMRLVRWGLDSMADYLRLHAENLNTEELKQIQAVISSMLHTANRIRSVSAFSVEQKLDTSIYLNSLIPAEKKHVPAN